MVKTLYDWVEDEEQRIDERFSNGEITLTEHRKLSKELYHDARGYEEEDKERYIQEYPGAGLW
jgi:hypothetical protein